MSIGCIKKIVILTLYKVSLSILNTPFWALASSVLNTKVTLTFSTLNTKNHLHSIC